MRGNICHMRIGLRLAIAVGLASVLALGSTPAAPATTERKPAQLYRVLKTRPFAPATVAGRFSAARISAISPSPTAARYHALGTIEVTFAKGGGSIRYTVFPSRPAAFNSWADYMSGTTDPGLTFEQRLGVNGLPSTAFMFLGALGQCDPTPCPPTRATFLSGVVHAEVSVTVRPNAVHWDRDAANALVRAAYAHLKSLQ